VEPTRNIVAMGGGGFLKEPNNPRLDDYVLGLVGVACPRVCFIPTASGDAEGYIERFYQAFSGGRAEPTHLSLFRRTVVDLRTYVLAQHVVYVGGGNLVNLLAVWRAHGLDSVLREAWEAGVVLCGVSAGALCWFESGVTDSFGADLAGYHGGLGLLTGSACPHFDGEPLRRPTYHRLVADGQLQGGFAADDGAAMHFVGTELHQIVSSRALARAYRVERRGQEVAEHALETVYL
jgi:peptidase E